MKRLGLLLLCAQFMLVLGLFTVNNKLMLNASADTVYEHTDLELDSRVSSGFLPQVVLDLNSAYATTEDKYSELIEQWREVNEDVIGYIEIDEWKISYPVLQGETNKDYLRTDIYGNYDIAGCVFMDANYPDIYAPVKLIHGHNMKDGSMFAKLPSLFKYETLDNAPTIIYTDDLGTKEFKIFAVFSVNDEEEGVIVSEYLLMDDLQQLKETYLARSLVPVSEVSESTELLMLNTCWYGKSGKERDLHCIIVAARV